jgi:hypothetical protein
MRKSTRLSQVKNSNPHRISKASTQSNLARSTSQIYPSAITMTQLGSANTLVSGIYGMSTIR